MKTTIHIDDALYRRVKALAVAEGRTVSAVIEDAVRTSLERTADPSSPDDEPKLQTFRGTGTMPRVDLDDNALVRDLMDEGEALDSLR